jgi:RHS repeat-associated protein
MQTFAGAGLPTVFGGSNTSSSGIVQTDIDANATTVTDQAGKVRRSITNGLGQLTRVDEPNSSNQLGTVSSPSQPTYYSFNELGKLVRVQQGSQNRYFMYDSLGRMLRVRQPEMEINTALNTSGNPDNNSWTSGFTYDSNGNVLTTTDAKGNTTTNTYDALNRVTQRSYNDSPATPTINFYYDGNGVTPMPSFAKGKLTKVENGLSQTLNTNFDAAGRLLSSEQRTPLDGETLGTATARASSYQYNLAGDITQETYPSGRVVNNSFDDNGDIARIFGKKTSTSVEQTYATSFAYTPDGKIGHLKLGNGLWESAKLNSRSQLTDLTVGYSVGDGSLLRLDYDYGELQTNGTVDSTQNAGNIAKQTESFSGLANPLVQTYKYDSLDRISEAKETVNGNQTWKQTFGYDIYGNRTSFYQVVAAQELVINNLTLPTVDSLSNRFAANQGYAYDKNGNITTDPNNGGRTFIFNGDNKQTEVKDSANVTIGRYYYDGNGHRVKKVTDLETTVFVYDGLGKLIAEYSTATPPQNPTINYTATDQLGSPRVLTDAYGQVVSRRDFMPFGEELFADGTTRTTGNKYSTTDQDAVRQRFTGYQKDAETGLDFAEARYYNDQHGRFTAVDPLLSSGKSPNPQTFNRYVYAMNRPTGLTDPTGLQAGSDQAAPEDSGIVERVQTWICKSFWCWVKEGFVQLGVALWGRENIRQDERIEIEDRKRTGVDKEVKDAVINYGNDLNKVTDTVVDADPTGILNLQRVTADNALGRASDREVYSAMMSAAIDTALTVDAPGKGITVLGKFPHYLKFAEKIGANRFNIPTKVWETLSAKEAWTANVKFLDRAITRGDDLVLSKKIKDISKVSGQLRKELDYLVEQGYKLSDDGRRMIK